MHGKLCPTGYTNQDCGGIGTCAEESKLKSEKIQNHVIQKQFKELMMFSLVRRRLGDHDLYLQIFKKLSSERGESYSGKC